MKAGYSAVSVDAEIYTNSPKVAPDIRKRQPSSVELLRMGTAELPPLSDISVLKPSPRHGKIAQMDSSKVTCENRSGFEMSSRVEFESGKRNWSVKKVPSLGNSDMSVVKNVIQDKKQGNLSENVKDKMSKLLSAIWEEQNIVEEDLRKRSGDSGTRMRDIESPRNGAQMHNQARPVRPCPRYTWKVDPPHCTDMAGLAGITRNEDMKQSKHVPVKKIHSPRVSKEIKVVKETTTPRIRDELLSRKRSARDSLENDEEADELVLLSPWQPKSTKKMVASDIKEKRCKVSDRKHTLEKMDTDSPTGHGRNTELFDSNMTKTNVRKMVKTDLGIVKNEKQLPTYVNQERDLKLSQISAQTNKVTAERRNKSQSITDGLPTPIVKCDYDMKIEQTEVSPEIVYRNPLKTEDMKRFEGADNRQHLGHGSKSGVVKRQFGVASPGRKRRKSEFGEDRGMVVKNSRLDRRTQPSSKVIEKRFEHRELKKLKQGQGHARSQSSRQNVQDTINARRITISSGDCRKAQLIGRVERGAPKVKLNPGLYMSRDGKRVRHTDRDMASTVIDTFEFRDSPDTCMKQMTHSNHLAERIQEQQAQRKKKAVRKSLNFQSFSGSSFQDECYDDDDSVADDDDDSVGDDDDDSVGDDDDDIDDKCQSGERTETRRYEDNGASFNKSPRTIGQPELRQDKAQKTNETVKSWLDRHVHVDPLSQRRNSDGCLTRFESPLNHKTISDHQARMINKNYNSGTIHTDTRATSNSKADGYNFGYRNNANRQQFNEGKKVERDQSTLHGARRNIEHKYMLHKSRVDDVDNVRVIGEKGGSRSKGIYKERYDIEANSTLVIDFESPVRESPSKMKRLQIK